MSLAVRTEVLRQLGATPDQSIELLAYNEAGFKVPAQLPTLPLPDEPFVAAWADYLEDARQRGAVPALRNRLRQFCFPVASGISQTPEYVAATRRGIVPGSGPGLVFGAPQRIRLFLHPTLAGRIPVLRFEHRDDFVPSVRALTKRNEPMDVPEAQGALMVAGYNNWDRIDRLRILFERGDLEAEGAREWGDVFRAVRKRRELYQDCFILLSVGPYSAVRARDFGLSDREWRRLSDVISLEHECAHYVTRRVFGTLGKGLHGELIADYTGITAAVGRFRADWFLRFMGLEDPTQYRRGGRLERYRGSPPLSDGAFTVLQHLVRRAAQTVEAVDRMVVARCDERARRIRVMLALSVVTLEELAGERGAHALYA